MKTIQTILILSLMAVTISACEETGPEPSGPSHSAAIEKALSSIEFSRAPGLSMEVLKKRVDVAGDAMYEVSSNAKTWQEAHSLAQDHIRDADPGVVRSTVEQAMAKLMLVGYLAPNSQDSGAAELALNYAQLLVEHGSPEAEAVLETVEVFGSEWKPAELQAVAIGAAEAVEAHVKGGTACQDCELPAEARRTLVESGQTTDVMDLRRLGAARQLRAIAE